MRASRRVWLNLFLSLVTLSVTAARASVYELPQELPRLLVTSYPESDLLAQQAWYRETADGRLERFFSAHLKLKTSDFCETLLEANQLFPFQIYARKDYVSPEQKAALLKIGRRLNPAQFRFFELLKTLKGEELSGRDFDLRKGDFPAGILPFAGADRFAETRATLWSVAGQTVSSHSRLSLARMPWQLDAEFADVKLDRERHRLAWEIGRGAKRDDGDIDTLVKAASLGMLWDTLALGEKLEDAYVFIHTLGKVQTRLFKMRRHPRTGRPVFTTYAAHGEAHENEVLIAKLGDVLATLPPESLSRRVHDLVQLGDGRLDAVGAVRLIFAVRDSLRQELDLVSPRLPGARRSPVVLRDTTEYPGWFMAPVAAELGVYDLGPQISRLLSASPWIEVERKGAHVADERVPPAAELAKRKLIGLSNLRGDDARAFPRYVRFVLLAAYFHYERRLAAFYPREKDALLARASFALNSSHPEVVAQAAAIPGARVETFASTDLRADLTAGVPEGLRIQPALRAELAPGFVFDRAALLDLARREPDLAREARGALRRGNWQRLFLTSDGIGF